MSPDKRLCTVADAYTDLKGASWSDPALKCTTPCRSKTFLRCGKPCWSTADEPGQKTMHGGRRVYRSEGRIMVGSSTEVHDAVPLENFLAMREAVLEYR